MVNAMLMAMETTGLRERKKARTRRHIARTAALLFAEHGYEKVSVLDVARAAEVAEQTVYNYFPTKERLVVDLDQEIQDRLCDLIRTRGPGATPAAAVREYLLRSVAGIRAVAPEVWRGELGYLAAISPAIRRLALESTDRQATAMAAAIAETSVVSPEIARLQGFALSGVYGLIIAESGRLTCEGRGPAEVAEELYPAIERVIDELDRWFGISETGV